MFPSLKQYKILHLDTYKMFLFTNTLFFLAIGAYSFIWIYHGFFILGLSIIFSYYLHFNYYSPLKISTGSFVVAYILILGSLCFLTYFYFWFDIFMIEEAYMLKAGRSFGHTTSRASSSQLTSLSRMKVDLPAVLGDLAKTDSLHPDMDKDKLEPIHRRLKGNLPHLIPSFGRGYPKRDFVEYLNN